MTIATPVKDRILAVLKTADGHELAYTDLARAVFTDKRAWKYPVKGGPPGCYMTLTRVIHQLEKAGLVTMWWPPGAYGPARRIKLNDN